MFTFVYSELVMSVICNVAIISTSNIILIYFSFVGSCKQRWYSNIYRNRMVFCYAVSTYHGRQRLWRCKSNESFSADNSASQRENSKCC